MKKKLTLLLTGLLVLSFIGCGSAPAAPSDASQSTAVVESSEAPETTDSKEDTSSEDASVEETPSEEVAEEQAPAPECSLKDAFAEHNMKVGTCLSPQMISSPKTSALILDQFNSVTMENAMKPDYIFSKDKSIEANDLVVEFNKDMVKMLDWAKENGMAVRGHTLVWYSQTPDWIFYEGFDPKNNLASRDVMLARMESMIKQMFEKLTEAGYADMFYAYDVVNEAWEDNGSIRQSKWTETIGDDYLWYAFYYANQYAPENIDLYYNDYNEQFKTDTLSNFVANLVDENGNYLIDGIGFQAHLYTQDDLNAYFKTVDTLSATGLKIQLTELDVSLGAWQKTLKATDDNLKVQGKFYYDLINGLFERVDAGTLNMDALTFWGFQDNLSWRKDASPLLYNNKGEQKYAYYGAMQMKEYAGF